MIKVAICEDSKMDRDILQRIIEHLLKERELSFQMDVFDSGESLVMGYSNRPCDLIFLDVFMGEIDGIEAGRKIRESDQSVEIVYCTMSKDFAIAAYEIHAMGYLLKPYEPKKIEEILDYYLQKHPQESQKFIEVKSQRKSVIIPYKDIIYMESDNKVVYIHTTNRGDIKIYHRLNALENKIRDERFLRCHQSYFVNMQYVAQIVDSDFIMENGSMVPIRKAGRKLIVKRYEEFLKGNI